MYFSLSENAMIKESRKKSVSQLFSVWFFNHHNIHLCIIHAIKD